MNPTTAAGGHYSHFRFQSANSRRRWRRLRQGPDSGACSPFLQGDVVVVLTLSAFAPAKQPTPPPKAEPSPNLFVSGLSKRTTTEGLKEAFAKFGEVVHARVVTDRVTSFSKGFGFVRYATVKDAAKGIEGMDGKFLDGWVIFAEYARPRPPPQQPETTSQPQQSWGPPSGSWGAR